MSGRHMYIFIFHVTFVHGVPVSWGRQFVSVLYCVVLIQGVQGTESGADSTGKSQSSRAAR